MGRSVQKPRAGGIRKEDATVMNDERDRRQSSEVSSPGATHSVCSTCFAVQRGLAETRCRIRVVLYGRNCEGCGPIKNGST